jgi:hypothetical protein
MLKTGTVLILFYVSIVGNSLYSDDVAEKADHMADQLEEAYVFSEPKTTKNNEISDHLNTYMHDIFKLSQLTNPIAHLTNESDIYSDIYRLNTISKELLKQLDKKHITFTYMPIGQLTPLQTTYQETIFRLHVISPYMAKLLNSNTKQNTYYVTYINKITKKITKSTQELIKMKNKLSIGPNQNQLPFSPNSPEQLSFALESQLNNSVLNLFNTTQGNQASGMNFGSMATPANADLYQSGALQNPQMQMPSPPNGSSLQMMQHVPNF